MKFVRLVLILGPIGGCASSIEPIHLLRDGEYLREDYIQALCRTLSPLKSHPNDFPELLIVKHNDGKAYVMEASFHDGLSDLLVKPDGALFEERGDVRTDMRLRIHDSDELILIQRGKADKRFRFVCDSSRWATEMLLAGDYRDGEGRTCRIERDGTARFPTETLVLKVNLDHALEHYDTVFSRDLSYGVVISPDHLLIYDLTGEWPEEEFAPEARWTLRRETKLQCGR